MSQLGNMENNTENRKKRKLNDATSTSPHKKSRTDVTPNESHVQPKTSYKDVLRNITTSKASVIAFLQTRNVLAKSMKCPGPLVHNHRVYGCDQEMHLKNTTDRTDGFVWRCRKVHRYIAGTGVKTCKDVKVSIRENSWLLDAKIHLEKAVEFIYLWSRGFDTGTLEHETRLSNKTIIEWSAYLREACMTVIMDSSQQIGGPGVHVEIDESKFGKRKYYRGHRVEGQWVFGGRERDDIRNVFMIPVKDRKSKTLIPIIRKWIKPGTIIHSDCWKAYTCLPKYGYTHLTVNHSKEFKNKETGACTNSIESDWRHAKVSLPRYGVHKGFHAGYLAEFMWKRKFRDSDKFLTLLQHLNDTYAGSKIEAFPCESDK